MSALALATPSVVGHVEISRHADGRRRRVLYAEDQASSRIVTTAMLEKMGFDVEAVDDGDVAVEKARESSFDVVLLDIEMPLMDGVTAARIIRNEMAEYKKTPILALSAFLADSTENCVWRDAFDSALPKPANGNELRQALSRLIQPEPASPALADPRATAAQSDLWTLMQQELPLPLRRIMVQSVASEMTHMVLAIAAAREAGEAEHLRKCRHSLTGLATNFGLADVADALDEGREHPKTMDAPGLLELIDVWREGQMA